MSCKHENIGTEVIMKDGKVISSHTVCDDCGKRFS